MSKDKTVTDSSSLTQIKNNLNQLNQLIERFGSTVDTQQTFISSRMNLLAAAESSEELKRLLDKVRHNLEELKVRVQTQEKEQAQLKALQEIGAVINSSLDLNEVLGFVMDAIIRLTQADRSLLLLRDEESGEMEVQVYRGIDRKAIEGSAFEISRSIVRSVAESGEPVVTMNAQSDPRFGMQESVISYNLRSILCVPLKSKDTIIGVIYADNRVASGLFNDADRDLLMAFANQAAVAIENARLFRQIRNHLAEITEMKDLMDNVFASIASGVITIDEEDRIFLYNHAAERILGMPADSVIYQTYQKILSLLKLPVHDLVETVKRSGGVQTTELDVSVGNRPGTTTLNMTLSPLRDLESQRLGVAMVLNDVSEKKRLESVRRYLPPALVDRVRDLDAAQRPQRRHMSVLFADVRGFSTFSEHLDPEELIEIINGYFTQAVRAITRFEGLTDKFMGDAVMALYNTPLNPQDDHIVRAVKTAVLIKEFMAEYHEELPDNRKLYFGIGIHAGEAVVGNVGSALRKDYSAIGDAVNLAKRLQENARPNQIIISQPVYDAVKDLVRVEVLNPIRVKGRMQLEQIYNLTGLAE